MVVYTYNIIVQRENWLHSDNSDTQGGCREVVRSCVCTDSFKCSLNTFIHALKCYNAATYRASLPATFPDWQTTFLIIINHYFTINYYVQ